MPTALQPALDAQRRAARAMRIVSIPNGVVVTGPGFYKSSVVESPGVILCYVEGTPPVASVAPLEKHFAAEAARIGKRVLVFADASDHSAYEHGYREAWGEVYARTPSVILESHSLVTATLTSMSANVLRMAIGGVIHSYGSRAEWEAAARTLVPSIDLARFEKRLGR